jgi:hypothetical protein
VPANLVDGSSRGSTKDYLRFPYIARGTLSETRYSVHLAHRLGYIDDPSQMVEQARPTFACLHGLICAVEKESGRFAKTVASLTSLLVPGLTSFLNGPRIS